MTETKTKHKTLVQALAAFQADLPGISLDSENPHFRSKFASLANITKAVFPKLSEQGLSFSVGSFVDNGLLVIDAHLMHEGGESRSMQIPTPESNPQKLGSFISYMRRYALASLTGIVADEDDDGNAASTQSPTEARVAAAKATPQPGATRNKPGTRPSPKDAQEAIRLWIDWKSEAEENDSATVESRRAKANDTREKIKKDQGLSGNALWEAVKAQVGA